MPFNAWLWGISLLGATVLYMCFKKRIKGVGVGNLECQLKNLKKNNYLVNSINVIKHMYDRIVGW